MCVGYYVSVFTENYNDVPLFMYYHVMNNHEPTVSGLSLMDGDLVQFLESINLKQTIVFLLGMPGSISCLTSVCSYKCLLV